MQSCWKSFAKNQMVRKLYKFIHTSVYKRKSFFRFKNFSEIFSDARHEIVTKKDTGESCFLILNVKEEDCGEVECRAFNPLLTTSSRATLNVHSMFQGFLFYFNLYNSLIIKLSKVIILK